MPINIVQKQQINIIRNPLMHVSKIFTSNHKVLIHSMAYSFSQITTYSNSLFEQKIELLPKNYRILNVILNYHSQSKCLKYSSFNSLTFRNYHSFCKSQTYINHYNILKTDIKEKQHKLQELQRQVKILRQMGEMQLTDQILQALFSLFGQNYETKAFKKHKNDLIDLRNMLEKHIEESSVKWEEPRKLILEQRQKKISEFIQAIIQYEGKMAQFIKQRQTNKAENLADLNEGLILTHKLLIKNIQKEGGVQIQPLKNQPFDQSQHQIVDFIGQVPKNAKVKTVVYHGWKLKEKVVRKAKITIS